MNESIEDIVKWFVEEENTRTKRVVKIGPMGLKAYTEWNRMMTEYHEEYMKHRHNLGFKHKSQKRLDREAKHKSNFHA